MAWHRTGDDTLRETMMDQFTDAYMRHSASMRYTVWNNGCWFLLAVARDIVFHFTNCLLYQIRDTLWPNRSTLPDCTQAVPFLLFHAQPITCKTINNCTPQNYIETPFNTLFNSFNVSTIGKIIPDADRSLISKVYHMALMEKYMILCNDIWYSITLKYILFRIRTALSFDLSGERK